MSIAQQHQIRAAPVRERITLSRLHPRRLAGRALIMGVIASVLAISGSWVPSIWGDEATSILSAQRSLPSLFRMLGHVDAVHGTYYLLLHFWVQVFGASAFSVRVPSAIAVGIAAAGVVVLANRLAGTRVGVFAGIVFAVLPRTTYMGEEARGYALSTAAVVWATILLLRLVTQPPSRRRKWALYAIALAGCGYVFLFSLLILPVHAVTVFVYRRRLIRRWALAVSGALVLALPVIVYGVAEQGQIAFLSDRSAATFSTVVVSQWFGNPTLAVIAWALIAVSIAVAAHAWLRRGQTHELVVIAATWLIVPMTVLLTVNTVHAVYSSRYLSFATPATALLVGWLIGRARRPLVRAVAIAVILAAGTQSYLEQRTVYAKNSSDWSVDAAYMAANAGPGDGILFDESTRPSRNPRLAMRAYPEDFAGLSDIALRSPWWRTDGWRDTTYPLDDVLQRLDGIGTVWLIEYRAAGTSGDTYDLDTLEDDGYGIVHRVVEHRSVILQLTRFD